MVAQRINIGCNPLCWMNSDLPSLGAEIPVEQCLSEIALIGYRGVELEGPLKTGLERDPQILRHRQLQLIAAWHGTHLLENSLEEEMKRLAAHMDYLRSQGGHVVNIAEVSGAVHQDPNCPLSNRPRLDSTQWSQLAPSLESLARFIRQEGMIPAYHHHMGTVVQSAEDIAELMNRCPSMGLLLDTGHLLYAGAHPLQVLLQHGPRVTHVHAKNVRLSRLAKNLEADGSFLEGVLDGVFTVPGDNGADDRDGLDFFPLLKALLAVQFEGWIMMEAEQDPQKAHPLTYARLGYHTLQSQLSKAVLARTATVQETVGV